MAKVTVKLGSKSEFAALHKNCPPISQADAAKMAAVSPRTMADAAKVLRYGTPEQIAEIETGKCSVSQQATLIKDKAHASRKAEALAQEQEKIAAYFAEHPDAAPAEAADGPVTAEGTGTAEPANNAMGEAPEADADPTPVAEMEADAKPVKTKAKKAKAEPKVTSEKSNNASHDALAKVEAEAGEARKAREAGDKALALIAQHMPGDAIESLHPLLRDMAHGGGFLQFLAGLAKLKPSHNGNSNDELAHLRAENDRLRQQVELLQRGDTEQQEAAA